MRSLTLASPVSHGAQTTRRWPLVLGAALAHLAGFRLEPRKMRSLGRPEQGARGRVAFKFPKCARPCFGPPTDRAVVWPLAVTVVSASGT